MGAAWLVLAAVVPVPVWSRSLTPATSVGRHVPVARNVPVVCGGVTVRPGERIVGDRTGVVVVPVEALPGVLELLRQYDDKRRPPGEARLMRAGD